MKKRERTNFRELLMMAPAAILFIASTNSYASITDGHGSNIQRGPSVVRGEIAKETQTNLSKIEIVNTSSELQKPIQKIQPKDRSSELKESNIEIKIQKDIVKNEEVKSPEVIVSEQEISTEEVVAIDEVPEVLIKIDNSNDEVSQDMESSIDKNIKDLKAEVQKQEKEIAVLKETAIQESFDTDETLADLIISISEGEVKVVELQEKISNLSEEKKSTIEAKRELEELLAVNELELAEIKALLEEKEEKLTSLADENKSLEEENQKLAETNKGLEEVTCKQENRLAALEEQVSASTSSPDIMGIMAMMQQQTNTMMGLIASLNSGFPMGNAASFGSNSTLEMQMLLSEMRFENRLSNFQNGIYSAFGSLRQSLERPTYSIGGDLYSGNSFSGMLQAPRQVQQQLGAQNFNTESLQQVSPTNFNFGNIIESSPRQGSLPATSQIINPREVALVDTQEEPLSLTVEEKAEANEAGV